jgi:16S rRNA (guanine527-N7)-methyltransferase
MSFSLREELEKQGLSLTDRSLAQFETYFELLIDWNQRMNLTAITDREGVMEKHFYDSLTPAFFADFSAVSKLIDIGAGAGFPSLPIKILFPHIKVTIVDSLNKRIHFLQELTQTLGLSDVTCIHGRAEEVAQKPDFREKYPLVMARAVARLPVLLELCLPFVQVGGEFIALKGGSGEEEVKEGKKALHLLGGEIERLENLRLPSEDSKRTLIWIKKVKSTPKQYPRKPGTPNKNPII